MAAVWVTLHLACVGCRSVLSRSSAGALLAAASLAGAAASWGLAAARSDAAFGHVLI